jgi:ABC-2 type transport system ATP-binding protein
MNSLTIEARGLSKKFDEFLAVDNLSLNVNMGEILVLLGPNGAGKTTTVRMLTSILQPTSGWAKVSGFDVVNEPDKVRASVGVLTEHHGLYGRMNADEYLVFFGSLYGISARESKKRSARLMEQFDLHAGKKRLAEYSKGMRQKLALIRALLHEPPVVLLDEPTSAMDPESAFMVREAIRDLRSSSRTIVLCTHNLREAEELADKILIIKSGRIILDGELEQVRRKLLGPQEFILKYKGNLDGHLKELAGNPTLIQHGDGFLHYSTETPETTNPQIVRAFTSIGLDILTLEKYQRSLEDIYLQIINQETENHHVA